MNKVQQEMEEINKFKGYFQNLFEDGLPSFLDDHGILLLEEICLEFLTKRRNDDLGFECFKR